MGLAPAFGNAACTATPPPASSTAAADADAWVATTRYRAIATSAETFRPAEPLRWQDLNRNVAPPSSNTGREP